MALTASYAVVIYEKRLGFRHGGVTMLGRRQHYFYKTVARLRLHADRRCETTTAAAGDLAATNSEPQQTSPRSVLAPKAALYE